MKGEGLQASSDAKRGDFHGAVKKRLTLILFLLLGGEGVDWSRGVGVGVNRVSVLYLEVEVRRGAEFAS